MSVNKHQPHIYILCEDNANRKIANGFRLNLKIDENVIKILNIADGWKKAIDEFNKDYAPYMHQFPKRIMILLIDFDQSENRFIYVENKIPNDLKDRVFILGVESNPEDLKRSTKKSFEQIGEALADDCVEDKDDVWGHELLKHNASELSRMRKIIKPFLFLED